MGPGAGVPTAAAAALADGESPPPPFDPRQTCLAHWNERHSVPRFANARVGGESLMAVRRDNIT